MVQDDVGGPHASITTLHSKCQLAIPQLKNEACAPVPADSASPKHIAETPGALGFSGYFLACFSITVSTTVIAVILWSSMGCGDQVIVALQEQQRYTFILASCSASVLFILFLLDFFVPPHLPGQHLVLYKGDWFVGRSLLAFAGILMLAACYSSAKDYPTLPLAITIFACPSGILLIRHFTMPDERMSETASDVAKKNQSFTDRMAMLRHLSREERNQFKFYGAFMIAFALTGTTTLAVWIPWAVKSDGAFGQNFNEGTPHLQAREVAFVYWAAPLIIACSNFIFACFAAMRIVLNKAYTATDEVRNHLIVGKTSTVMNHELMQQRMAMLQRLFEDAENGSAASPRKLQATMAAQDRMQFYLVQHISHMKQLSHIVKTFGCILIVVIGALYVAFQLTAADNDHVAQVVQAFVVAFFVTFLVFVYVSFNRLWRCMKHWLTDMPLWNSAVSASQTNWFRTLLLVIAWPVLLAVVLLSALNQVVRRIRRLTHTAQSEDGGSKSSGSTDSSGQDNPVITDEENIEKAKTHQVNINILASRFLTPRVYAVVASMRQWDWLQIVWWIYTITLLVIVWKFTPPMLNVMLSWMSDVIGGRSFTVILIFTFTVGMVLFMLPPIPGPPIYLFGGFVISDKCPLGFWWGAVICVLLCFALKLSACAVQQTIIGQRLGSSSLVKQTVGVHKPFVRAIEAVLQRPGLSFGKCVILCGGPDWPTSVLAGILNLSLFQCLLGTFPILVNLVPLTLTGSFYLKRAESEVWTRAGNLMFILTLITSIIFWAGMGWAIQNEFDKNHEALTAPKVEYVHLDWLDYRSKYIANTCAISWRVIPRTVKASYLAGVTGMLVVAQVFIWRFSWCLGTFRVNDEISTLVWFGEDGLFKLPSVICLSATALCCIGLLTFRTWKIRFQRGPASIAAEQLAAMENEWKRRRTEAALAYEADKSSRPSPSFSAAEARALADGPPNPATIRPDACTINLPPSDPTVPRYASTTSDATLDNISTLPACIKAESRPGEYKFTIQAKSMNFDVPLERGAIDWLFPLPPSAEGATRQTDREHTYQLAAATIAAKLNESELRDMLQNSGMLRL